MTSRERLIGCTAGLLQRRGYAATSVGALLAEAQATKGSLYFHFPGGKEELCAAALQSAAEEIVSLTRPVMDDAPDARTAMLALITAIGAGFERSGFERGCPLATSALEAQDGSSAIRDACARGYADWLALLAGRFERDGVEPQQAEEKATFLLASIEGALLLARVQRDLGPLRVVARQLAGWLPAG